LDREGLPARAQRPRSTYPNDTRWPRVGSLYASGSRSLTKLIEDKVKISTEDGHIRMIRAQGGFGDRDGPL
jgi:hypothetical protein